MIEDSRLFGHESVLILYRKDPTHEDRVSSIFPTTSQFRNVDNSTIPGRDAKNPCRRNRNMPEARSHGEYR
jgi:hypothetical protein